MSPTEIDLIGLELLINEAENGSDLARELATAFTSYVHAVAEKDDKIQMARNGFPRAA